MSKIVQNSSTDDSTGEIYINTETHKARIRAFKKRKAIRGTIVTDIRGIEIGKFLILLQAPHRRCKMRRKETREFDITSYIGRISFALIAEVL